MPNIETAKQYSDRVVDEYVSSPLPVREVLLQNTIARDAAIRAESAELLRVCGEALKAAKGWNKTAQETLNPDRDIPCDDQAWVQIEQANNRIDTALAALKDAGVRV